LCSTCRYYTVHVPCGISIQTSPVGLPLQWWGVRMRNLKGQKWIYLTQKRIEMFYSTNQSYHWKSDQSEVAISGRGETSRDFRWGLFWSSMRTVSLPVAPHRSSNATLSVPIYSSGCNWTRLYRLIWLYNRYIDYMIHCVAINFSTSMNLVMYAQLCYSWKTEDTFFRET
jgi:hypothetical protein